MCDVPKQTLVLVHGYLGGGSQWAQQREALSENFLVITPSLPGYGHNMCMESPHTIQEYAEHVIAVLDSEHIEHFMLLGHSMGGMIAQEIARRRSAEREGCVSNMAAPAERARSARGVPRRV